MLSGLKTILVKMESLTVSRVAFTPQSFNRVKQLVGSENLRSELLNNCWTVNMIQDNPFTAEYDVYSDLP